MDVGDQFVSLCINYPTNFHYFESKNKFTATSLVKEELK